MRGPENEARIIFQLRNKCFLSTVKILYNYKSEYVKRVPNFMWVSVPLKKGTNDETTIAFYLSKSGEKLF